MIHSAFIWWVKNKIIILIVQSNLFLALLQLEIWWYDLAHIQQFVIPRQVVAKTKTPENKDRTPENEDPKATWKRRPPYFLYFCRRIVFTKMKMLVQWIAWIVFVYPPVREHIIFVQWSCSFIVHFCHATWIFSLINIIKALNYYNLSFDEDICSRLAIIS